jgi:catechol 2,3-dioxygenase-like lactoylglutathione lyase family enzyme
MLTESQATVAHVPVLSGAPIVYLILYVNDLAESRAFYEVKLKLPVLEADEGSVKFDAGRVVLCLNRAQDYGVELAGRRDDASDIVFLVDDINAVRASLEKRGVEFVRRRTYEIGLVTDFYDPNGHRLMIYQPSPTALSWPSAAKLRDVWRTSGRGTGTLIGPPALETPAADADEGLAGKPLVYLFLFVPDSADALQFYQTILGLNAVENVHCCNPACPPEEKGIAKYDAGGLLLTTHHIHRSPVVDDFGKVYSPRLTNPAHVKGIVPVFHVRDLAAIVDKLKAHNVAVGDALRSHIGDLAWFEAPTGHRFCVYSPSAGALLWPAGRRLSELAAAAGA